MLSKYPPIQGGESSKAYWLVRGLGSRKNEVHVVTNAMEVENEFREKFEGKDLDYYLPPGVNVHNTDPFVNPHYIPYSNPFTEKLSNIAIEIIQNCNLQLIDTWYLLPYSISGLITKTITGKPLIVRHAGSDISRLFSSPYLNRLFVEVFRQADKIVTYPRYKDFFLNLGIPENKLFYNRYLSVDTKVFNPNHPPLDLTKMTDKYKNGMPIITFLGKFDPTKGLFELLQALEGIDEDFLLILVTGGRGVERLWHRVEESPIANKTMIMEFLPPWRVASLLCSSTCVVCLERDFPIAAHSPILPREVMASGTCLIISKELFMKRHSDKVKEGSTVLVTDPYNKEEFKNMLRWVINNPESAKEIGYRARKVAEETENFEAYLNEIEELYHQILEIHS